MSSDAEVKGQIHNLSPQILNEWIKEKKAIVIDVREPSEYRSERIEGAVNIPLSQISAKHSQIPHDKNKKLVFHCARGRRSMQACEKLTAEGITSDVWNLEGGIKAWSTVGFPVQEDATKKTLPLEQQTQAVAGFLIFSGVLLGALVYPAFYVIPGLIGLGLMGAGLTGWCGMTKVLAEMPWNKS